MENNVVYILQGTRYEVNSKDVVAPQVITDINGVFSSYEKAQKMGEWLLSQEPFDGMKYTKYEINDFIIL